MNNKPTSDSQEDPRNSESSSGSVRPFVRQQLLEEVASMVEKAYRRGFQHGVFSAQSIVETVLKSFGDRYPTDIWPEDGNGVDCASARFARQIIKNIRKEITDALNAEVCGSRNEVRTEDLL